jgi:hypothetical protein
MKLTKLRFVLSKEFIELCAANIDRGMATVIRLAERRYVFANPKATEDIDIDESDVNRALSIAKNEDARFDRLANVYSWIRKQSSKAALTWSNYRAYITANALEKLWVVTGVYKEAADVEVEFNHIVGMVADAK